MKDMFVSESGADTDGCGKTAETPCRTMSPVLAQLSTEQVLIPPDPVVKLDEVWYRMIYPTTLLSNWQTYWNPQNGDCKLQPATPSKT